MCFKAKKLKRNTTKVCERLFCSKKKKNNSLKQVTTSIQTEYDIMLQLDEVLTLVFIGNLSVYTQQPVKVTPF